MAFAALGDRQRAWGLMNIINPLHHGRSADDVKRYKVEPYVVSADVYSVPPHTGRGGWSWYTGSAGWMYRLVLESLLGLRLETTMQGAFLHVEPCLPADWAGYTVDYRFRDTLYKLHITQGELAGAAAQVVLDGAPQTGHRVPLVNDGQPHHAQVRPGSTVTAPEVAAAK